MENDPQTAQIIGAAMEVHRELGPQHRGIVYRTALIEELKERGIETTGHTDLSFTYKGKPLQCIYVPFHLVCFGTILIEIKAITKLLAEDQADLRDDLLEARCDRGLLLNFARPRLEIRRVVPAPPAAAKPSPAKTAK